MSAAPPTCGPTPSSRQLDWHELRLYGFLHFTVNTFTDAEWGFGDESPDVFAPTDFDADQIVEVADAGGLRGLILTCKHHDGFCLWPTRTTTHSVASSAWRGGGGDVVGEIAHACERRGLAFGVYLSPWDRNHAAYGHPEYVACYREQLRELLTGYGPVFEVWHDGANGGDGFYGGARETRTIDKTTYYGWQQTWDLVRELQPQAVIFSDVGPDIRWVGNESGEGSGTTWLTMSTAGASPGSVAVDELGEGHEGGDRWLPPEVDVSIRPGWFYHAAEDERVKTVPELLDIYHQSVGRSGALLLNLPPDRRGRIHEIDARRLRELRRVVDATYGTSLAAGAVVTASDVRGGNARFAAAHVADGDEASYWATNDRVSRAWIELDLGTPQAFDRVLCEEAIAFGQRVRSWHVEVQEEGGRWRQLAAATTIGARRILSTPHTMARRLRVHITDAKACPLIRTVAIHRQTST